MIKIALPDKSVKSFDDFPTGFDVSKSISEGFARNCIAMEIDGSLFDLGTAISKDSEVKFITKKDPQALHILWHSTAHVMAQAILHLYKDAKLTIGPPIKDGFYYDIDMDPVSEEDFPKIEAEMKKAVRAKLPFIRQDVTKTCAMDIYKNEPYKLEMISELKDGSISLYSHGDFTDLCRGPHIPNTSFIKAFKLMKVSGAYWRGDQKKAQLQRIYGISFFDKKDLDQYVNKIEEAKKRNHRKIGQAMDLFSFQPQAPGMPFFHPKGMAVWNALLDYWRMEHKAAGYVETKTPIMLNRALWEQSGHWENYRENMYMSSVEDIQYAIKPMNCPGGMLLYKSRPHSYKELPIRAAEIGIVHRHELSGVLSGLFRVRAFHQDDAHIFMTQDHVQSEIAGVLKLIERIYKTFGLKFHIELSTRPEKSIGDDKQWETATNWLKSALESYGRQYKINPGDGAFYGPKIDVHITDALERTWQCGTIQLDMSLPERFDLTYIGPDNEKHRPIMIHRVIYGSIERFFGILTEHFAGKFPLWLAPVQVKLLPINDDLIPYALLIEERLASNGLRTETDRQTESLNKKIRDAQLENVPLMLTIGHKEKENSTLSVRTLSGQVSQGVNIEDFIRKTLKNIEDRNLEIKENP